MFSEIILQNSYTMGEPEKMIETVGSLRHDVVQARNVYCSAIVQTMTEMTSVEIRNLENQKPILITDNRDVFLKIKHGLSVCKALRSELEVNQEIDEHTEQIAQFEGKVKNVLNVIRSEKLDTKVEDKLEKLSK